MAYSPQNANGQSTMANSAPVVIASNQSVLSTKLIDTGGTNAASVSDVGAVKVDGSAVTQPVSLSGAVAVTDNSGSLTVDAPAATPLNAWIANTNATYLQFYAVAAAAGTTTTETAITLTKSSGTSSTSTGTSFVVTSGKKFRILSIMFATRGHNTATAQATRFNLRINTAGAVTTGSTPILLSARCATPATANAWDRLIVPLPDAGLEIHGDGTLQFGITAAATYTTNAPTWDVLIFGYEY